MFRQLSGIGPNPPSSSSAPAGCLLSRCSATRSQAPPAHFVGIEAWPWKGYLQVDLNPAADACARDILDRLNIGEVHMSREERAQLLAERTFLKRMLERTPLKARLTRMSDEARLRKVEARLAELPSDQIILRKSNG